MANFLGIPYPIVKSPLGFFASQSGTNQIKADILQLLLTNPGERVMNPNFGTGLKSKLFEPNDPTLQLQINNLIVNSIKTWEPRIVIKDISVTSSIDPLALNPNDPQTDTDYILYIKISFIDPQQLQNIQEISLEIPLGGT